VLPVIRERCEVVSGDTPTPASVMTRWGGSFDPLERCVRLCFGSISRGRLLVCLRDRWSAMEIHGTCPACGDVILEPRHVELITTAGLGVHGPCEIRFRCPVCTEDFRARVEAAVARALWRVGARHTVLARPPDERHPEDPPAGPPLTYDDLLTFHELLESDNWFERCRDP
jgi:hypothetical protein